MLETDTVEKIFFDCLFKSEEIKEDKIPEDAILVDGITNKFGFHPNRILQHKNEIIALLNELPENFHVNKGGGWSFLNACIDKDGNQWGEHRNIEQLVCLGIGIKRVSYNLPRELWSALPGSLPYFIIHNEDIKGEKPKTELCDKKL